MSVRAAAFAIVLAVAAVPGWGFAAGAAGPSPAVADPQHVTHEQARRLVEAVEAASAANDPRAQAAYLAADVTITSVLPHRNGARREVVRSRDEYIQAELEALARTTDSVYTSRIEDVRVAADGRSAQVQVLTEHAGVLDGRAMRSVANQMLMIEIRDGRPVVVAIRSTLTGLTVDGQSVL